MASLEFKQRVKLPEEFFLSRAPAAARRRRGWPLVLLLWLGFSGLCFGINTGRVPLGTWVEAALGEPAALAAAPVQAAASPTAPGAEPPAASEPKVLYGVAPSDLMPSAEAASEASEPATAGLAEPAVRAADAEPAQPPQSAAVAIAAPEPTSTPAAAPPADPSRPPLTAPEPTGSALDRPAPASRSSAGTSCEAAVAKYQEEIRIGGPSAPPDLSRSQYAAVLENGSYFSHCGVPGEMSVDICVAVRGGRVLGVTVGTDPGSTAIQGCVARAVRGLSFPSHPRLDVTRTRFSAN